MRILLAIVLTALVAAVTFAQEPPLPGKAEMPSPTPSPAARPQLNIPDIPISVEPPTLVPDASPLTTSRPQTQPRSKAAESLLELDTAFKQSPLAQAAEEQRLHLEWRQLQNRTANDPEVVAAKAATTRAKTDLDKRARLKNYYEIYYAHMQALASTPEVKRYLEGKKAAALGVLAQNRVRSSPTPQRGSGH